MAEDDDDVSYVETDKNPYTLTDLSPLTTYYALVTPVCGDNDQDSEVITFTTADLPCPRPDDLVTDNITISSATFSWTGEGESYNIQYRTPGGREIIFYEDFENGTDGWTETSVGSNTGVYSGAPNSGTYMYGFRANGSYIQYLISPELSNIEEGSVVAFYHLAYNANATIYVGYSSTTTATNQFTWGSAQTVTASTSYDMYAMEIPAGTKYVGIRVNALSSSAYYFVDDFFVAGPYVEPGEWHTVSNVTSPYTATGLDPETDYEWQVQAVCGGGDGESLWAESDIFTTPSACDTPVGLTATDITDVSATLNWPQSLVSYNLRYGTPETKFSYDFEDATPWAVDDFSPCTTYDGDGSATGGIQDVTFDNQGYTGSFIAFQNGVATGLDAHGGNAFGACVYATTPANNDFFILPSITIETGDVFSFWALGYSSSYPESFKVGVYNGNGGLSSYLAGSNTESITPPTDWTQYSYDLSAYNGQSIQLAINCVSDDAFIFAIDDIFVGNPHWETPITCSAPYTLEGLEPLTDYAWQVQGRNCSGTENTDWSGTATFTTTDVPDILVESITVNPDEIAPTVGATYSIIYSVLPADATNPAVTFSSDDEDVATVDENGTVTAVAAGIAKITIAATDGSGVTGTLIVTVTNIDVEEIDANDVTVVNGETATINYQVLPQQATDKSVTFTSANTAIATVDATGVVTGVGVGETTITIASVQNPDVTTDITVTVESNPFAVQFTVNAPATAYPGDVITVGGILTAPTNGWNGFTALILDLTYDNTAFEYVAGSQSYGPVATQAQQTGAMITPATLDNAVQLAIIAWSNNVTTEGVVFSAQFTVKENAGGSYTFTAVPHERNLSYESELLIYEATPSTVNVPAEATFARTITGYGSTLQVKTGWNLIASPISSFDFTTNTMISGGYDLYRFNQSAEKEWENYKSGHDDFTTFETGRGYLYAHDANIQLSFTGRPYVGDGVVSLTYDDNAPHATTKGWNLIGNPFGETAYLEGGEDFYIMNGNGSGLIASEESAIGLMYGIFVQAEDEGESVTFTTTEPNSKRSNSQVILNVTNNNGDVIDRAIVRFNNDRQLGKLTLFEDNTKIYIPQDDADYAIVSSEGRGNMPINFKADEMGSYTIVVETEGYYTNYLHLIDRLTGDDVNLLVNNKYTFIASNSDIENRFILSFGDNANNNFAYQSGSDIVVTGDGELQIFDVMGRYVGTYEIHGVENIPAMTTGVYIFRMIGEDVKTQKIVVR